MLLFNPVIATFLNSIRSNSFESGILLILLNQWKLNMDNCAAFGIHLVNWRYWILDGELCFWYSEFTSSDPNGRNFNMPKNTWHPAIGRRQLSEATNDLHPELRRTLLWWISEHKPLIQLLNLCSLFWQKASTVWMFVSIAGCVRLRQLESVAEHVCTSTHRWRLSACVFFLPSGGEASWAGQAGFPQHAQEVDCLSAGSAGRGRGQEVRQVALGEIRLTDT